VAGVARIALAMDDRDAFVQALTDAKHISLD
jgi:hypothetical protein